MPLSCIECDMTSCVLRHDSCMYVMQSRVYTCMCVMQSRVDMCDYEMQSRVNICTDARIRYASSHVKWFICNIAGVYSTPRRYVTLPHAGPRGTVTWLVCIQDTSHVCTRYASSHMIRFICNIARHTGFICVTWLVHIACNAYIWDMTLQHCLSHRSHLQHCTCLFYPRRACVSVIWLVRDMTRSWS